MAGGWQASSTPADTTGPLLLSPVLIGRSGPLAVLQRMIAAEAPDARVAVITGEAGIGKSRVLRAAREQASDRGYLTLHAACFPDDDASPYACIRDLLRAAGLSTVPALDDPP